MVQYTRNETLAVSTTSIELAQDLEKRGGRKAIVVRNISPNAIDIITIALGDKVAVANSGIILKQNEVWYDANESGYEAWQNQIQIVCATINGLVSVMER